MRDTESVGLDSEGLPSIRDATLPGSYEAAKTALAQCSQIDECAEWANKAKALASYAKQADDKTLENLATRIRARVIRRCGELLKEIQAARGANQNIRDNGGPKVPTRTDAATGAGLSERQRKQALRVASIPAADFDAAVEAADPPTVSELARRGTKSAAECEAAERRIQEREAEFSGHDGREIPRKRGRPRKATAKPKVAEESGIPERTRRNVETHVRIANAYPFMQRPDWRHGQPKGDMMRSCERSNAAMPKRIQRHPRPYRTPAGAIYIGRPTRFGNHMKIVRKHNAAEHAAMVTAYKRWLVTRPWLIADARRELAGRDLECYCPLALPCHADVLLAVANAPSDQAALTLLERAIAAEDPRLAAAPGKEPMMQDNSTPPPAVPVPGAEPHLRRRSAIVAARAKSVAERALFAAQLTDTEAALDQLAAGQRGRRRAAFTGDDAAFADYEQHRQRLAEAVLKRTDLEAVLAECDAELAACDTDLVACDYGALVATLVAHNDAVRALAVTLSERIAEGRELYKQLTRALAAYDDVRAVLELPPQNNLTRARRLDRGGDLDDATAEPLDRYFGVPLNTDDLRPPSNWNPSRARTLLALTDDTQPAAVDTTATAEPSTTTST